MGKRRIRNLHVNGEKNIIGFDIVPERLKEAEEKYGIKTVKNLNELSEKDYDAMLISASPEAHAIISVLRFAKKNIFL